MDGIPGAGSSVPSQKTRKQGKIQEPTVIRQHTPGGAGQRLLGQGDR